jgi:hypothetical protein
MKALLESGDLSLADARSAFLRLHGRPTTLTDEQIIETWADDVDGDWYDDELFSAELLRREEAAKTTD